MPQRLAQHLIARGLLKASSVDEAMRRMSRSGGSLDTNLLEMGAISEAGMLQAISDVSGVRLVNLSDFEPNTEAGPLMPYKMAKQLGVTPLSVDGIALHLACTYPIPQNQLKDVGFLLGRKLELWVSLEVRVKNWQSHIYGQPLEARMSQLLTALEPPKRPSRADVPGVATGRNTTASNGLGALTSNSESVSAEVLERIARGIVDEPVLLSAPKKKSLSLKVTAPVVTAVASADLEEANTSVLEADIYSRFAKATNASTSEGVLDIEAAPAAAAFDGPVELGRDEVTDPTRVLDLQGYEQFARQTAAATDSGAAPKVPVRFPGGVAPPRRSAEASQSSASSATLTGWVQPALPSRPTMNTTGSAPLPGARVALPTTPAPTQSKPSVPAGALAEELVVADDAPLIEANLSTSGFTELPADEETDFSDVTTDTKALARPPPPPPVTAPPPARVRPMFEEAAEEPETEVGPIAEPIEPPAPEPTAESGGADAPMFAAPLEPTAEVNYAPSDPNVLAAPPGLGSASAAEWTLAQARQSLKDASQDREYLVSVMLEYGRRAFEYCAAFAVLRGSAYGWDARGDGDLAAIRDIAIPLDAASVFRTVALTRGSYVGPLPPDALSQHYLALLGRGPRTVFVWPVEVQGRLVAIIYGDCGSRPVSQRRLSDFILFCQDLPAAFHDLIVYRKLNPPAAQQYAEQYEQYEYAEGAEQQQAWQGEGTEPGPSESEAAPPPTDADWFHGLMSLLTGPDASERAMAMGELLKTPEASAKALASAFPGPTGWSRLPVVELPEPDELGPIPGALSRLGALGAAALAPLLDSPDSDARYLALLTAGSLPSDDVVDGVMRGLFDLEPDISSAARSAAARLKALPAFTARMPSLRQELTAADPLRRSLAARALGVLHDREAIDGLINLAGSEDDLCSTSAAEALKEVTRASFGTNARAWSAWWAGARSARRVDWLVDALGTDDFDARLSAIEELSRTFGDNHGFFADGPRDERDRAVEQWRALAKSRPDVEL